MASAVGTAQYTVSISVGITTVRPAISVIVLVVPCDVVGVDSTVAAVAAAAAVAEVAVVGFVVVTTGAVVVDVAEVIWAVSELHPSITTIRISPIVNDNATL